MHPTRVFRGYVSCESTHIYSGSTAFAPKSDMSTRRIVKSKNAMGLSSNRNIANQSRPGTTAAMVRTTQQSTSITIDLLDYEYNHVRFWPKLGRLDPSYHQIEKWHRSLIK